MMVKELPKSDSILAKEQSGTFLTESGQQPGSFASPCTAYFCKLVLV